MDLTRIGSADALVSARELPASGKSTAEVTSPSKTAWSSICSTLISGLRGWISNFLQDYSRGIVRDRELRIIYWATEEWNRFEALNTHLETNVILGILGYYGLILQEATEDA